MSYTAEVIFWGHFSSDFLTPWDKHEPGHGVKNCTRDKMNNQSICALEKLWNMRMSSFEVQKSFTTISHIIIFSSIHLRIFFVFNSYHYGYYGDFLLNKIYRQMLFSLTFLGSFFLRSVFSLKWWLKPPDRSLSLVHLLQGTLRHTTVFILAYKPQFVTSLVSELSNWFYNLYDVLDWTYLRLKPRDGSS